MQVNSRIQRNVHIEIKMTETEAENFIKASSPNTTFEIEVASLVKNVRESILSSLYPENVAAENMAANHTRVRNT